MTLNTSTPTLQKTKNWNSLPTLTENYVILPVGTSVAITDTITEGTGHTLSGTTIKRTIYYYTLPLVNYILVVRVLNSPSRNLLEAATFIVIFFPCSLRSRRKEKSSVIVVVVFDP